MQQQIKKDPITCFGTWGLFKLKVFKFAGQNLLQEHSR